MPMFKMGGLTLFALPLAPPLPTAENAPEWATNGSSWALMGAAGLGLACVAWKARRRDRRGPDARLAQLHARGKVGATSANCKSSAKKGVQKGNHGRRAPTGRMPHGGHYRQTQLLIDNEQSICETRQSNATKANKEIRRYGCQDAPRQESRPNFISSVERSRRSSVNQ
ncbi:hypothetical protein B0J13DRAFT_529054 [Dactylonectria estremocensis]|uniref:Uncharacterized protein n=1 Tax=Dactylonectria estremocensis TaxID=1079267 RepID=A0A9P9E9J3_9HYPO|nr:hypothetical protein B0J13DRAFT_529054 [Dactylonectria estremocensis]